MHTLSSSTSVATRAGDGRVVGHVLIARLAERPSVELLRSYILRSKRNSGRTRSSFVDFVVRCFLLGWFITFDLALPIGHDVVL